jgi:hypothetical protein
MLVHAEKSWVDLKMNFCAGSFHEAVMKIAVIACSIAVSIQKNL